MIDDKKGVLRSSIFSFAASILLFAAMLVSSAPASAQFTQQGPPLVAAVGTGGDGDQQGASVSVSADGNTAVIGGPEAGYYLPPDPHQPAYDMGAAWVWTRSNGAWTLGGVLLDDAGYFPGCNGARVGASVALSSDGNTVLVSEPNANCGAGAATVWVRGSGTWTMQQRLLTQATSVALSSDGNTAIMGEPYYAPSGAASVWIRSNGVWAVQQVLAANDAISGARQGISVVLSADSNTAIVGGYQDNNGVGAAWVWTRSDEVWTEQQKLIAIDAQGVSNQGSSVTLSSDGNRALVGGSTDNSGIGAAWVWTRSNGAWTEQQKLVASDGVFAAQGSSVALSGDGNTAFIGGPQDMNSGGAFWVWARNNAIWSQVGPKRTGAAGLGAAVALSADGTTAIAGAPLTNTKGAALVFVRSTAHDFNGDGMSDIAWRDTSGDLAIWLMNGGSLLQSGEIYAAPGWSLVGQRDFNGDGKADLLWRDSSGDLAMWFMNGVSPTSTPVLGWVPTTWNIVSTADFNGDGMGDILWQDGSGNLALWLMNGTTVISSTVIGYVPTSTWTIVAARDFNGDGKADILWRDNSGTYVLWLMNGTQILQAVSVGYVPISTWTIIGTGDFNGDGKTDILWRDTSGDLAIWLMNGATITTAAGVGFVPLSWSVAETGDFNGDGMSDLLWRDNGGNTVMWFMNGTSPTSAVGVGYVSTAWTVQSLNAE